MRSGGGEILALIHAVNRRPGRQSLAELSRVAHRSPWNLHRLFRQVAGEPPGRYLERVRLDRSAARLLSTDLPVSAVAADSGFDSHEGFTRAFRRRFGTSPIAYRSRGLAGERPDARRHADLVDSVSPCLRLYNLTDRTRSSPMPVDVTEKDVPAFTALVVRRRVRRDEIAGAMGECLPAAFEHAQRHGLALVSPPFTRYGAVSLGGMDIECGFAIASADGAPVDGEVEVRELPACRAAVAVHRGPYDSLHETYAAIEEWLADKGLGVSGPAWETYLTDPGDHPDPATWETEVAIPFDG